MVAQPKSQELSPGYHDPPMKGVGRSAKIMSDQSWHGLDENEKIGVFKSIADCLERNKRADLNTAIQFERAVMTYHDGGDLGIRPGKSKSKNANPITPKSLCPDKWTVLKVADRLVSQALSRDEKGTDDEDRVREWLNFYLSGGSLSKAMGRKHATDTKFPWRLRFELGELVSIVREQIRTNDGGFLITTRKTDNLAIGLTVFGFLEEIWRGQSHKFLLKNYCLKNDKKTQKSIFIIKKEVATIKRLIEEDSRIGKPPSILEASTWAESYWDVWQPEMKRAYEYLVKVERQKRNQ